MVKTTQRLDFKLTNHAIFVLLVKTHGYSVRSLTDTVNDALRKKRSTHRVTRSVIGHLHSGLRSTCHPEVAAVIAELFKLKTSDLFSAKTSNVQREVAA